ncbi:TetR/AcrR family transcriptional regulator [Streptomyces sp. H27-D2]|uniref:TetR/AcrR family transcriptional regulator n=1 Tax=Streptomyces sp. H27-D2 TaxID=3046304 RepID=UPI002DC05DF5|nr:TetR/AcrR family transcriptional regulator [Streptomyces sp. H27-D2]MEC4016359.1 TetR/AcrR family transcriptional regulator [Streptomyces sp. H27-D2]
MTLDPPKATVRPSAARRRLLSAADELFYAQGIDATGVDAIIEAAEVARMTFYKHFRGKDTLVVAYLQARDARWNELLTHALEGVGDDPRARLIAVFDALGSCHADPDFRGCSFANAAAELAHRDHPARAVVTDHKKALREDLTRLTQQAGFANVGLLVDTLLMLYEGATTTQALGSVENAIGKARTTVQRLLDSWPTDDDGL